MLYPFSILGVRGNKMSGHSNQLKKLAAITTDLELSVELRRKAIELLGGIGTHEALLILLELAANDKLTREEREFALKQASEIVKSGH